MSDDLQKEFKNPSNKYRAKPFWAWNGELEEDEILSQTDIMEEMGFGGFFMHSRVGLSTEYLGDKWFDITNKCADYAEKKGLESWLYDEDRWPSGSAGGMAAVKHENRMKYMRVNEGVPDWSKNIIAAFSCRLEGINVYDVKRIYQGDASDGDILWFDVVEFPEAAAFNGTTYIDTMKREATEEFIKITHEKYAEKCGNRLGNSIKGIFTDEPNRCEIMTDMERSGINISAWTPYTDDLFTEFEKHWGYDLRNYLPQLFYKENGNDVAQVKWHYCETIQRLFLENFMKPVSEWCHEHNMIFTGHMLHENTLSSQSIVNGSLMRSYELMDYPGVDVLGLHTHNYNIVKQLSSAAHQTGKKWLLSELYGCSGWQASFEDFKRVGDWQALFGINLRCPHLSWYTMAGQRKRDYPASIFYQSAWYKEYRYLEDYFARIAVFMNEGKSLCETLVINPVESMWCQIHKNWAKWLVTTSENCLKFEKQYRDLYNRLLSDNVEYDYGDEEMLARLAKAEDGCICIGDMRYKAVIVSGMLTMRASTYKLLKEFESRGGKIAVIGELPEYIDALPKNISLGNADYNDVLSLRKIYVDNDKVFSSLRFDENDILYIMLLNMNYKSIEKGKFTAPDGRYEMYNPETGEISSSVKPDIIELKPGEMRLYKVYVNEKPNETAEKHTETEYDKIILNDEFEYETDEPNVLVVDRVKCIYNGKEFEGEVLKADSKLRDECGIEQRSGNMYQPWYQKKMGIKRYFDIELIYTFKSEIEKDAYLAAEQAERCSIEFNGKAIKSDNSRWIDKCMKKFKIHLIKGINTVKVKTYFADDTDIESIYILGDFGVYNEVIKEKPLKVKFGDITKQGFEFYGGKFKYIFKQEVMKKSILSFKDLCGGAAIKVNNKLIAWAPYETIVEPCKQIEVELMLTRRNTFGPFHLFPMEESAGPRSFVTEGERWTDNYMLIPCGIDNEKGEK